MSFEEFEACVDGWNKANGGNAKKHPRDLTDDEFDEGERLLDEVMRRNANAMRRPDGD